MKRYWIIMVTVFALACNTVPNDIVEKHNSINEEATTLDYAVDNALMSSNISEHKKMVQRLKTFKNKVQSFKTECDNKGVDYDCRELLHQIKTNIFMFEGSIKEQKALKEYESEVKEFQEKMERNFSQY